MSHTAKALVLHCIDFRFIDGLNHWLDEQGLTGQYDRVAIAGAVKNLVDPAEQTDPALVMKQIDISKRLHAITEVWLINHRDCGAYGKIFANDAEEYARHRGDLLQAQQMVKGVFPDLQVRLVLAALDADHGVTFEAIA